MRNPTLALLTALFAAAGSASATGLPAQLETEIRLGETSTGELDSADAVLYDGKPYDRWSFRGSQGDRVAITMRSSDFDTYLTVLQDRDGQLVPVRHDDDGAGGTDSRIYLDVTQDGDFLIYASTYSTNADGSYTLTVEPTTVVQRSTEEVLGGSAPYAVVRVGDVVTGELTAESPVVAEGSAYEAWSFEGRAGEAVDVEMIAPDFDAYLRVGRENGPAFLAADDDGAGGTDALVNFQVPEDGRYVIVATAFDSDPIGQYTLRVSAGEPMVSYEQVINGSLAGATELSIGETVGGVLDDGSPLMTDRTRSRLYAYRGRAGERITVTLRSSDFDAYLGVGQAAGETEGFLMQDDDSGGGTDARLTLELPSDGMYGVLVNTLSAGEQGSYTLEIQPAGDEPVTMTDEMIFSSEHVGAAEPVGAGQTVIGYLDESSSLLQDGSRFDVWRYSGRAGERVILTMRSEYFDAFLKVGVAGDPASSEWDDDGAGGTDARLETVLDRDGELIIVTNALSAGESGRYTLTVESS